MKYSYGGVTDVEIFTNYFDKGKGTQVIRALALY
jgi:hypothetical protein